MWLIVFLALVVHGGTYLIFIYDSRSRRQTRLGEESAVVLFMAWVGEFLVILLGLSAFPFGLFSTGPKGGGNSKARPVLLVHGWAQNRASMALLAARLRRDGRRTWSINYPSLAESNENKTVQIARCLEELARESPSGRVDVVAHSLGGVLVRDLARDRNSLLRLGNVVTLGSPHKGTNLAMLSRSRGMTGLRPGSRYLQRLEADDALADRVRVTSIGSTFDAIVFPVDRSYYAPAMNVTVSALGHNSLLISSRIYQIVYENLEVEVGEE